MGQSEARASASPCALAGAAARNHGFILTDIYAIDDDGCATCRTGASCFRKYERRVFQRRWAKWRKVNHVLHGVGLNQRAHLSHYLTASDPPPHHHHHPTPHTSLQPVLEALDKWSVDSLWPPPSACQPCSTPGFCCFSDPVTCFP